MKLIVQFEVNDGQRLQDALQAAFENDSNVVGMRTDADPALRAPLQLFAAAMERKLLANDHKQSWRELPVEALLRLLLIEIDEYKVAHEFLTVAEARKELVDVANFALILWDRLSIEPQDQKTTNGAKP